MDIHGRKSSFLIDCTGIAVKKLSGVCQFNTLVCSHEQVGSQVVLQDLQAFRQGRLADALLLGCGMHVACLAKRKKILQMAGNQESHKG